MMPTAIDPVLLAPIAALGLVFGSFTTALSYRLPRGESIARGRSRCPSCGHTLTAPDLVPVLSWVVQRGACRHCRTKISARYPLIEAATTALFIVAGLLAPDIIRLTLLMVMTPAMMAIAVIDLEWRRVPNGLVFMLAVVALGWRWHADQQMLVGAGVAAAVVLAGWLLDAAMRALTGQTGLGMGDTKLLAVGALALPLGPFFLFATLAGVLGVISGVISARTRWPQKGPGQFPFAPAILGAFWIALVVADPLLEQLVMFCTG